MQQIVASWVDDFIGVVFKEMEMQQVADSGWRRWRVGCWIAAAGFLGLVQGAGAATLFYNGDIDTGQFTSHAPDYESRSTQLATDGSHYFDRTYASFTVPTGQSWDISGAFGNFGVQDGETIGAISQARYEIRSGISAGNGGTSIASGIVSAAATATGQSYIFGTAAGTSIQLSFPDVTLNPGTYWVEISPLSQTQNRLLVLTSNGNNAMNSVAGQDYRDSNFFNLNYTSTMEPSIGLTGTTSALPEPALMGIIGIAAMTMLRRRRGFQ
jgi:hypothetical protein